MTERRTSSYIGIAVGVLGLLASIDDVSGAPSLGDEAFARAVIVVGTYDHFAASCVRNRGFEPDDARAVAQWEERNRIALVRARLTALEADPATRAQVERIRESMVKRLSPIPAQSHCQAALSTSRLPEAQLATNSRTLLDQLSREAVSSSAQAAPTASTEPAVPVTKRAPQPPSESRAGALARLIDSFGFDTRTRMGVGGFLTTVVVPVVLFRDGRALQDADGLSFPGGLDAHQNAHPRDWTRWRRSGDSLQLVDSKGEWRKLPYGATYGTLPRSFRLDGSYQSLSGAGTLGVGGTDSVIAWRNYAFSKNGLVVRGGGAGAYAAVSGGSTAISSIAPSQRGRYRIDGITLSITYDDGSSESRIIVTDPKDSSGAIWLDGVGYARQGK